MTTWYLAAILGWLMMSMLKGADRSGASTDPFFIVFSLIALTVIALALDRTMLIVARGDTLHLTSLIRRTKLRRDSCRFVVRQFGRLRTSSHAVLLTDGQRHRRISHYWMWGDFLATRAVKRLEKSLLEN